MRKSLLIFISVLFITALTYSIMYFGYSDNAFQQLATDGIFNPHDIKTELVRRMKNAIPHSPEARQISRLLENMRRKKEKGPKKTENPSAFYEALAELKTSHDGKTYSKNYKAVELKKARNRDATLYKRSGDRVSSMEDLP